MAGIVLARYLPLPTWQVMVALIISLLALWLRLSRPAGSCVVLFLAVALLGFLLAGQALTPTRDSRHILHLVSDQPRFIEGVVLDKERSWDGRTRVDVAAHSISDDHSYRPVTGKVRIYLKTGEATCKQGDTVRWRAELNRPRNFGTPGEFDHLLHLASQEIFVTCSLQHAAQLVPIILPGNSDRPAIETLREKISSRIDRAVPPSERGLVKALVIGQRGEVSPVQRELLSLGGVAHLFAISGMHFGLLALLLYTLCRWLYSRSEHLLLRAPPQRYLPLLLIIPLYGYLLLSGNALATRRAFLMAALGAILFFSGRRTPPLQLLATIAFCILSFWPLALFQPAFQLSFAGLLGILVWVPCWQNRLPELPTSLKVPITMFLATLAATLSTAPFIAWHFHQLAPAGLLTNMVAIPLIGWIAVPFGLFGAATMTVSNALADLCFAMTGALVALSLEIVGWFTQLPGLQGQRVFIDTIDISALSCLLIALLITSKVFPYRRIRLLLLIAAATLWLFPNNSAPPLTVTALSVGQADATLISFKTTDHYLVDGGGWPGSSSDPGQRLVAPALGRLGAGDLSGVILTHDHPDHRDGLVFIIEHVPVKQFWSAIPEHELHPQLLRALQEQRVPIHQLERGWTLLSVGNDHTLSLFSPEQSTRDVNERSVVVYAAVGNNGVLLPGDLGGFGLQQLAEAGLPGPSNLLKIPHHGSRHSAPGRFLALLQPEIAFVSAGHNNRYRLPHQETLADCEEWQVPLLRTDRQGTLFFELVDEKWRSRQAAPAHWD
jgi:competence protein ComEC